MFRPAPPQPPMQRALALLPLMAGLLAALLASGAAAQPGAGRPNVVVILADDLGYGDLGAYGSPDALTPHLDALADRGLRLTDFYAGGPVCTPSRYALLTGLHPFRNGDPELLGPLQLADTASGIDAEAVTLAEALRAGGYETALIGKWHPGHGRMLRHGAGDTAFHPLHHGFDHFFGLLGGGVDYNTHWNKDRYLDWWEDRRPVHEDTLRYATHVLGERAAAYVAARAGAGTTRPPFFLYLPFTAPHAGMVAHPTPLTQTQLPLGEERAYLSRFDPLYPDDTDIRKRYLAMLAVLDDEVGRIVGALDAAGLTESTLVWFISDNGAATDIGASTGGFRARKGTAYEGGVRVPSFVAWPGRIAPGVSAQPAANVDVLPTVLSLAGVPLTQTVDGLDLSDHLLGGPAFHRGVAVPNARRGDAYRLGRWKLVRRYDGGVPRPAELYDLAADLAETTDLAAAYPDTVALLAERLPYGRPPEGAGPTDDPGDDPGGDPPPAPPSAASLRVLPNPSAGVIAAAVEVALPEAGPVRVEAFDALGRRLAVVHDGPLEAGVHRMVLPPPLRGWVVVRASGPFGALTARATRLR